MWKTFPWDNRQNIPPLLVQNGFASIHSVIGGAFSLVCLFIFNRQWPEEYDAQTTERLLSQADFIRNVWNLTVAKCTHLSRPSPPPPVLLLSLLLVAHTICFPSFFFVTGWSAMNVYLTALAFSDTAMLYTGTLTVWTRKMFG